MRMTPTVYELKSVDTQTLAPGQYFVLVQHPMMNAEFDIYYDSSTGSVINRAARSRNFHLPVYRSRQPPESCWCQRSDAGN